MPKHKKRISNKNSYIKAITTFNEIPNNLKTIPSKVKRKIELKKWIKAN